MFQACKRIGLLGFLGSLALVGCGGAADVQSDADPAQSLAERAGAPLFEGMGEEGVVFQILRPLKPRHLVGSSVA